MTRTTTYHTRAPSTDILCINIDSISLNIPLELGMEDVNRLYLEFAPFLEHILRAGVRASDDEIEEACQAAWVRLLSHRRRITKDAARGWLTKTAIHEVFRLYRRERRALRTSLGLLPDPEWAVVPEPQRLLEQRETLETVRQLPRRQQRVVWLRALGLSYGEMAAHEGCTSRTVERQLERARRGLRKLEGEQGQARRAA